MCIYAEWDTPIYSLICQLGEPKSSDTSVPVSTLSTHLLVSNTIVQKKEPGLLRGMVDSRTWAGKIDVEAGTTY